MQKEGLVHHTTQRRRASTASNAIIHFIFLLLVLLAIGYVIKHTALDGLTGSATYDPTTAQTQLETALSSAQFLSQIPDARFCVAITTPEAIESFFVEKTGPTYKVMKSAAEYCGGPAFADFTIKYNSYDDFVAFAEDPSLANALAGIDGGAYQILPSRYVEAGGNVICNQQFKSTFCSALTTMATPEELIKGDLSCCMDTLTKDQQKLLQKHLEEDKFQDELPRAEWPKSLGPLGRFLTLTNMISALFVFIMLTIGIFVTVSHSKNRALKQMEKAPPVTSISAALVPPAVDPAVLQVKAYTNEKLSQGYTPAQIQEHLLSVGWSQDLVNTVFTQIQKDRIQASAQQQATQEAPPPAM
ncbi:hypothetical protein HZB03_03515 [Candidatus Woesearchaeota archaeon]|nr:hypothetical protein [Candidatus Woesearchaeota archaeon]